MRQCRHVQLRKFTILQHIRRVYQHRGMPQNAWTIEDKPRYDQPEEDRYVDRLAEPPSGALVLDGIEQVNEFVLFQLPVTIGAAADGRNRNLLPWVVRHKRERGIG